MSSEQQRRLHQYLLGLDEKQVSRHDPRNQMLEKDVLSIVNKALAAVTEKDSRFKFKLHGSGSFYDGVKVGSPDEFDYVAEITTLQDQQYVTFIPTDDPGFVQIKLNTVEQRWMWKDCLSHPDELQMSNSTTELANWIENSEGTYDPFEVLYDFSTYYADKEDFINEDMILAPFKLQAKFKAIFDKVMPQIDLPANWEHGGYQRPNYGGCRWHGPATMIMLVYHSQEEEIKINVDVTIGIPVPVPVNFNLDLNMTAFKNVKYGSMMEKIITRKMKFGPPLHFIPLYSKMLVKVRRYSNKFAFRISCSNIEKAVLNAWPDQSGPKKRFRILKVIRDEYFVEGRRKTQRIKKKNKQIEDKNLGNPAILSQAGKDKPLEDARIKKQSLHKHEHLAKDNYDADTNGPLPSDSYLQETGMDTMDITKLSEPDSDSEMETEVTTVKQSNTLAVEHQIGAESKQKSVTNAVTCQQDSASPSITSESDVDSDTTDLTEVDETTTKEEAGHKFQFTRRRYQSKDISDMNWRPGSGEYYGPRAYMTSIEIKTHILKLLGKHWDPENWTDEKVCGYVEEFLEMYHNLLLEKKMIRNCFFDTMVCSPITEEQRIEAIKKYNMLQEDFNDIMDGIKTNCTT